MVSRPCLHRFCAKSASPCSEAEIEAEFFFKSGLLQKLAADHVAVDGANDKLLVEFGQLFIVKGEVYLAFLAFAEGVYPSNLKAKSVTGKVADPGMTPANCR